MVRGEKNKHCVEKPVGAFKLTDEGVKKRFDFVEIIAWQDLGQFDDYALSNCYRMFVYYEMVKILWTIPGSGGALCGPFISHFQQPAWGCFPIVSSTIHGGIPSFAPYPWFPPNSYFWPLANYLCMNQDMSGQRTHLMTHTALTFHSALSILMMSLCCRSIVIPTCLNVCPG